MKTIRVKPVLVPTNDIGAKLTLYHDDNGNYPQLSTNLNKLQYHANQKLILISLEDEKIEEGDKVLKNEQIFEVCNSKAYSNTNFIRAEYCNKYNIPKVIATQEQLSSELIQQLVDEYNNKGMQDFEIEWQINWKEETLLQMEANMDDSNKFQYKPQPKLTNGFVTVVEKSDNFTKFLKERIDKASSTETKAAYTIILEQYKKEILYTEEEVLNMIDKYDEAKWGCPARKGMEEITFWFNKNKKK